MTPKWMPPLPSTPYVLADTGDQFQEPYITSWDGFTKEHMDDYALAAVESYESYKRSLKPVAWVAMSSGEVLQATDDEIIAEQWRRCGDQVVPAYRLDGGDDANAA